MKRTIAMVLSMVLLLAVMTGCKATTTKSFTYRVETGDQIKVKLETLGGYDITSELPFSVTCEDQTQSQGTFITEQAYAEYEAAARSDAAATVLDAGENEGSKYIFWCYNDTEWNYAIHIGGSHTGVILANGVSEESAKECFQRLTFTLESDG